MQKVKRAPGQRKRVKESNKDYDLILAFFSMIVVATGAVFLEAAISGVGVFA